VKARLTEIRSADCTGMQPDAPSRERDAVARPAPLRFGEHFLEEFTQRVLEWTREHHPERLKPPDAVAPPDVP
jgi:hypothetical protein